MQYPLRLPHTPQPGELPIGEYAISPLTSCAYCCRRLKQRDAYIRPQDGETFCNKTCQELAP